MTVLTRQQFVVKDLWALRLQKLQNRATYDSATDTETQRTEMFSSQSEGESGTGAMTPSSQRSSKTGRKKPAGPSLLDPICLQYIGSMLLKMPLTVADFCGWVNDGKLLYYRATKELPLSMRVHLPGHLQEQLEPQTIISPDTIHHNIKDTFFSLQADFGMKAPPVNGPLVLYRWIQELSLPLEIFIAAQRLGTLLDLDYSYNLDAKAGTNQSLRYPEIRLMALVVITTKLLFPFDDMRRYPESANDLNVLRMDWNLWAALQNNETTVSSDEPPSRKLTFTDAFSMTQPDSMNLCEDSLDEYLDWCEENIASEEMRDRGRAGRDADFRRALFEWFPSSAPSRARHSPSRIEKGDDDGKIARHKILRIQQDLCLQRAVQGDGRDDIPRAGVAHIQYRSTAELEGTSKLFYRKAAFIAGTSLHGMVRAVFMLERLMMKHEKLLRKGEPARQ